MLLFGWLLRIKMSFTNSQKTQKTLFWKWITKFSGVFWNCFTYSVSIDVIYNVTAQGIISCPHKSKKEKSMWNIMSRNGKATRPGRLPSILCLWVRKYGLLKDVYPKSWTFVRLSHIVTVRVHITVVKDSKKKTSWD